MPDIGPFHPILVHFVVAGGILGVGFRLLWLTGKTPWASPAAAALLILTGAVSIVAAEAGHEAHEVVDRIPGVREQVHEHEEWGERTRNLFVLVGLMELAALTLRRKERAQKVVRMATAALGVVACFVLYQAGDHGGDLVYSYAGGVGTRTGDPADVRRLLIAGLYHQARVARDSGNAEEAARLTDELVRQDPTDPSVRYLAIQSTLEDRKDPAGALAALDSLPASDNPRTVLRVGLLRSQALKAMNLPDSARAVLEAIRQRFPDNRMVANVIARMNESGSERH